MSELSSIKRVVTGHNEQGKAVISSFDKLPKVVELDAIPGTIFHEVWSTSSSPVVIDNGDDPTLGDICLSPPTQGTRIRFVDIPPDSKEFLENGASQMKQAFSEIGEVEASTVKADSSHPLMHRTESVDYGVVIKGEITLVLDDSEAVLKEGDVIIQRGTNHAWANRSGEICRMLFVLIDGQYGESI